MERTAQGIAPPKVWIKIGIATDLDYFIENISMLLSAGMGVADAIGSIKDELRAKKMRKVAAWLQEEVAAGSALSDALEATGLFPDYTVSLIRIGEESGRLSDNLTLIGEQQKKERLFRSRMRSALLYPLFVLGLTVTVGIGIAWFILPRLALVFDQLNVELPTVTYVLITAGKFLAEYGAIAVPAGLAVLVALIYFLFYFEKTNIVGQIILLHLPGTGRLIKEVEIARFSYLLSSLLQAGLPITRTIESLAQAATFPQYRTFYRYLKGSIANGNSFQKSFDAYKHLDRIIPSPVQQLVIAGEQSGNLPQSLANINEAYESRIETTSKNLTVILEPVLLVIVWLGVVAVALAVILPIYSLIGGFNTNSSPGAVQTTTITTPPTATSTETSQTQETATPTATTTGERITTLEILPTGLGYLNVRNEPSLDGEILRTVTPGDTYPYTDVEGEWYQIRFSDESVGWVFGTYVSINENHIDP